MCETYESPCQPHPAVPRTRSFWVIIRKFLQWFFLAVGVQVAAWLLMFACDPLRPIYFYFYYPVFLLLSGPSQSGLGFFLIALPAAGTLIYSTLFATSAALVSSHYRRPPHQ